MSRARTEPALPVPGLPRKPFEAASLDEVCLANGRYTVHLDSLGAGYSDWGRIGVTRWPADRTCRDDGFHVYLRDLDDQSVWSMGYQPMRVGAEEYSFSCNHGIAHLVRSDGDLESALSVCVAQDHDIELRRCRLANHGRRTRRIELTSYLEWVLAARDADLNHPAFSKLFVETQFRDDNHAIIARRRPRSSDDPQIWGLHWLVASDSSRRPPEVEHETNRVAFIGRGRTLQRPRALDALRNLGGQTGPVLDPIGSLRCVLTLEPGESQACSFLLGVGQDSAFINVMLAAFARRSAVDAEFHRVPAEKPANGAAREGVRRDHPRSPDKRLVIHGPHTRPRSRHPAHGDLPDLLSAKNQSSSRAEHKDSTDEALQFNNGYGGFSADGRAYVIRLQPDENGEHRRPPLPWVNVIANERAGFTVSESGAGCTWSGNSRLNRLTAWHNDPVRDPHSEVVWIRDDDAGEHWSVTPGPTPVPVEYIVRHGFGSTTFEVDCYGVSHETTMFMAPDEPVKITRLRLANRSRQTRRLSIFSYAHWALGGLANETARSVSTAYDAQLQAILATNPAREHYGGHVAFSAVAAGAGHRDGNAGYTCDRAAFLGPAGDLAAPAALALPDDLDRRTGTGLDPCAAWRVPVELPSGAAFDVSFLLGETATHAQATALIEKYRQAGRPQHALQVVESFWRDTTSAIEIETPDREIDLVVNGWLAYQNLSCRMWGRSAYYQPGGAFGFRDQLQDAAALLYLRPDITRNQIIRHASRQFVEGDVLHWWHDDTGYGLRTRFSDDLLWLPFVTASYVETTGDRAILDEVAPFLVGPGIAEGHAESYFCPTESGERGTIYEHCCRALDRGLTTGVHGLPLIGCGDWNDGFSRIGRLGRGESVWLGFFIHNLLEHFLPICVERGNEHERVARYTQYRDRLVAALNTHGWDGAWYRRAYYDNGQPVGSARSDECQIDALAQAWAVLSGAAPPERACMAIEAVMNRLVDREAGIIKLLTPAFNRTPHDPGYIKGYLPGIRENGGQYTHGVLWVVRALAEMGRGTTAVELLRMLSPVSHTATRQRVDVYQTEPYVVAADIYGERPHVGRGGWTWYTGSAGWMFRIAVESIFGLTIERGRTLVIKPAISASWPCCRLTYRLPGEATSYEIRIENPHGKEQGVTRASVDGEDAVVDRDAARIPLLRDGARHRVVVWV